MNEPQAGDPHLPDFQTQDELDRLFAAARQPTPEDLGAADRFLAVRRVPQRHTLRLWAGTAVGVAAALGGLMLLHPVPAELPPSAAYSVYQSALGDGW